MVGLESEALRRRLPHDDAAQTQLVTPLDFAHGVVDVVRRDRRDADQLFRRGGAVLDQPVVVDAEARLLQRRIAEAEEGERGRRVEDLGGDTVGRHLGASGLRVGSARMRTEHGILREARHAVLQA